MTLTLDVDGRTIAYEVWGPVDGKPWIFIGGTPSSRYLAFGPDLSVDSDLAGVSDRSNGGGPRVVTFDRPGYGRSDRQPGRRIVDVVPVVAALADTLGWETFNIFGVSGGSPHALACGARLGSRVLGVTICGQVAPTSMPNNTDAMLPFNREMAALGQNDPTAFAARIDATRNAIVADPMGAFLNLLNGIPDVDRALLSRPDVQERAIRGLTEALRPGSGGWHDDSLALLGDWGFTFDEVLVPARLYHGGLDVNCPLAHAKYVAANLPDAELTIWPDLGHMSATVHLLETGALIRARS